MELFTKKGMYFIPFFLISLFPSGRTQDCTMGFSVVSPELAAPGKTTAVLVTLHGPVSMHPLNVTLKLMPEFSEGVKKGTTETTAEIKEHGIIPLEIPEDASGVYTLKTMVNCSDVNTVSSDSSGEKCSLQSTSKIRLVGPVRDVIIRPDKHGYRPGEIVSFWVLALDHDLQLADGAIGTVSVKDSGGTKVAVWDQVQLDEGVKSFSVPLSQYIRSGRWLLHVEVESMEFSTSIDVAPSAGNGLPDISAAEEHYVELRFGKEMRRRYKPGLPFTGKVEAMSTEKSVRVRVKVYDNTTSIYSQDIEISNGEGRFIVPAILADSDVITLQAELVSVESKEIESHYVLAREPIQKWNSTSDCYLLIEGVENTLMPEEEAHVAILSTCPCERDLHYVITTDGQVTDWAQRRYEDPVPEISTTPSGAICRLYFSFMVRSVMAPVSQLLVYYVTPQGEPVSDVISFDIKLLHRQVYINMEERDWWLPNQPVDLEVVAEPSSLVCLLGGRAEPNGDVKFDPRLTEDRSEGVLSGEMDFLEAGVSFFQKQCSRKSGSELSTVSYKQRGSGAGPSNRRRPPESLVGGTPYDHLWLWKCFNYTSQIASNGVAITSPSEPGKWSLWALSISNNGNNAAGTSGGLRFSSPVQLQVYLPLQVEFKLPQSLKVRETLEVDIKIGNNINSCMDVTALLALSEGAQFLSNGLLYVTERLRLGPRGATSLVVKILVTTPGLKNMTVEVNGYTSSTCEGSERTTNATVTGAVIKSATVNVQPEAVTKTRTESAYFCANENLLASTVDSFRYEWMTAPKNRNGVVAEFRGLGPVKIALSETQSVSDHNMYRIDLGDVTWIGRGEHDYSVRLNSTKTPGILDENSWKTFWITWNDDVISFGKGFVLKNDTVLSWKMDKRVKIQHLGFSSSYGSSVECRIWNFNEEAGFSQVLHLDTPNSIVPGTETGTLTLSDTLTPPLVDLTKLEGGSLTDTLASISTLNSTENLAKIVQTILSYKKPDNSFSEHQMLGSHRMTLNVLSALWKIQGYFGVDPELIQSVKRWIQLRQEDDGKFSPLPSDVKLDMNVTSNTETCMELTAETVIVLYEIGVENDADAETVQKAKIFLENNVMNIETPSAVAAVTLALVTVRSATSQYAIEKLRNASTTEDGEFGWPQLQRGGNAANWFYENGNGNKNDNAANSPNLEQYKASISALKVFLHLGDLKFSESVAKFLFYRTELLSVHPQLLYGTIDAFSMYQSMVEDSHKALTVSLATSGMELTDTLSINKMAKTHIRRLPSLPTKVFVYATGAGCAAIQGKVTYSSYESRSETALLSISSEISEEIAPDKSSVEEIEGKSPVLKLKTCFRWISERPSGVLRMEVSLFSGFELVPSSVTSTSTSPEIEHGYNGNNVWFIFANVTTLPCPICVNYKARSAFIISSLRPGYARIYPAGRKDLSADTFFHGGKSSVLLREITEDDLITWFKHGGEAANNLATSQCVPQSTPLSTPTKMAGVATYTINVAETIESNLIPDVEFNETSAKKYERDVSTSTPLSVSMDTTQEAVTKSFPVKHVNKNIQEIPKSGYMKKDGNDEMSKSFNPEMKNDKYVMLDKEKVWSLLKEIVKEGSKTATT